MSDLSRPGAPGPDANARTPDPVPGWIAEARPPVPEALLPWLTVDGEPGEATRPSAHALTVRAVSALERSLPDGDRTSRAFHLLAADALLTWAAEATLEEDDPVEALVAMARRAAVSTEAGDRSDTVGS